MSERQLTDETVEEVIGECKYWFGIIVDRELIETIGKRETEVLWPDLLDGAFDTMTREYFIDELVQDVLPGKHWPSYGEGPEAFEIFIEEFRAACTARGIGLIPRDTPRDERRTA